MGKLSLPPGFRFHPTDEELVSYYLRRKVHGRKFKFDAISEVDLYKHEPWDLPEMSVIPTKDLEWYFFCPRDKKYANGSRTNRATDLGYWKATGKDRSVSSGSRSVGMKKTLVYYKGRAPRGERTNWVMHEYRLEDAECDIVPGSQNGFVLCRVYRKSGPGPKNGEQYGAPVEDDGWETAEDDDSILDLLKSGPDIIERKPVITSTPGSHSKQVAAHESGIIEPRSPSSNLKLVSVKVEPEDIKMSPSNEKLSAVETLPTTYTDPFITGNLASSTYVETDMLDSSDLFSLAVDERDLLLQLYDEVAGPSGGVYKFGPEMGSKCFEPFVDPWWNQIDLQAPSGEDFLELNDLHFTSEADDNITGIEPRQITKREISASDLLAKSRLQCDPETKQKELSAHSSGDDNPLTSSFIFKDNKLQALQPDISGCSFKDLASEGLEVSAEVGLVQAMKMQPSVITCTLNTDYQDVVEGFLDYDGNVDKVGMRDDGSHHIAGEMVETDDSNDRKSPYYRKEMSHGNADCGTHESDDPSFRAEGRNYYDTSFSSSHTLDRFGFSGSGQTSYTQNETSVNEKDATNNPHLSKASANDSPSRILAVNEQVDGRAEKQNAIDESQREAERTKDLKGKSAEKTYGILLNCLETLPILPASAADLSPNSCLPANSISIMATSVDVSAVTLTCNCAKKASSCIVCSFPELGSSKTIVHSLTSSPKHSMAGSTADLGILALFGVMMALFWLFIIGGALKIFGGIYRLVIS